MKIRNLCALLLALMLLALAGCGQKEQPTQPENPDVPQEEAAAPVRLVCSNGSTTLRFSREEDGHWLWADDKTFPLDESYALTLLETVQGIESLPPVTTAAQLADYGLESSAKYVTLTDSQDTSVTYRLGKESDGSVYVYREGAEATVYAVPDLLGQIGRSIYDMMALPELPQLTAENVQSLTVAAGDVSFTLTPAEGAWTADGRDVTDQLADLTAWLGDMHLTACVDWRPSAGAAALCGLCVLLCPVFSPNVKESFGLPREETMQYQFAAKIAETPGATLLNYGFMDAGFYTAAQITPNVKYYHQTNVPLQEMLDEQVRYIHDGVCDYVVTRGRQPEDILKTYDLIAAAETPEGFWYDEVYLYRKKGLIGEEKDRS